jgi:hypothetical protein
LARAAPFGLRDVRKGQRRPLRPCPPPFRPLVLAKPCNGSCALYGAGWH